MRSARAQQDSCTMGKLVKLYELRQAKARKAYQAHQKQYLDAKRKVVMRDRDYMIVLEEKAQLQMLEQAPEYASDLSIQQHIVVKRHWLKYDFDKAQYLLNDARADLEVEQLEADKLRSCWMQLRAKCERFEEKLLAAKQCVADEMDSKEESDLEEELMCRLVVSQIQAVGETTHG